MPQEEEEEEEEELGHIYNSEASSIIIWIYIAHHCVPWWCAHIRWSVHVVEHMFAMACVVVQIHDMCCFPVTYDPVWWCW